MPAAASVQCLDGFDPCPNHHPVVVFVCVFDELSFACFKQFLFQFWMCGEFQFQALVHYLLFHLVPVLAYGDLPCSAHLKGVAGGVSFCDESFIRMAFELFRLKVVFVGDVFDAVSLHWGEIEV